MKAIIACDAEYGYAEKEDTNLLPWSKKTYPDHAVDIHRDMSRFVTLTNGQIVVMGAATWEHMAKFNAVPLDNRVNVVLTNRPYDNVTDMDYVFDSFSIGNELSIKRIHPHREMWCIGGWSTIRDMVAQSLVSEIHLTKFPFLTNCDRRINMSVLDKEFKVKSKTTTQDGTVFSVYVRK